MPIRSRATCHGSPGIQRSRPRSGQPPGHMPSGSSTRRRWSVESRHSTSEWWRVAHPVADPARPLRVAVLVRSVFPLHGVGGLERHAYDLVRHHLADGLSVWLVTHPGTPVGARALEAWSAL